MIKTEVFRKMPWGIIAAVAAMIVSFATIAVIVLYEVDCALTIEGSADVTLFDTWYQTLLFITDCLCGIVCVPSVVFYFIKERAAKVSVNREEEADANIC